MQVYSFVAMSNMDSFSADAKKFFNYLTENEGFPAKDQNLLGTSLTCHLLPSFRRTNHHGVVFQLGTEAFTGGPAKFTVSHFSASVDY
jgi:xyloglucan-specific endo-beta-1,4-glucanase